MEERHLTEIEDTQNNMLLNTIRIPKNLHFLTERLPKANYALLKTKKVDKHKFLQTLAGYKEAGHHSAVEDMIRGSESVDSYKKDKEHGRIYLPPVGKEAQTKDIIKIYGGKEKREPVEKIKNPPRVSPLDHDRSESEVSHIRKNPELRKKPRGLDTDEDKDISEREKPKNKELDRNKRQGAANRIAYKVHDLNQDAVFDQHAANIKNIYGGKSNAKLAAADIHNIKDPSLNAIKRHKNQMMGRSPSQE